MIVIHSNNNNTKFDWQAHFGYNWSCKTQCTIDYQQIYSVWREFQVSLLWRSTNEKQPFAKYRSSVGWVDEYSIKYIGTNMAEDKSVAVYTLFSGHISQMSSELIKSYLSVRRNRATSKYMQSLNANEHGNNINKSLNINRYISL